MWLAELGSFCNGPKFFWGGHFPEGCGRGCAGCGFMSYGLEVRRRHLGRHPGCILQLGCTKGCFAGAGNWVKWIGMLR